MIGISPLDDGQTANTHIEYIEAILAVYDKTTDMVKFLVGDNCFTNRSIGTMLRIPLVGCASHRYNLAVNRFLSDSEDLISQIRTLMTTLCLLNNAVQVAHHMRLLPEYSNATRWSSVWRMMIRYV
ncbi:hypothetical protein BBJ28_00022711 [Nothophytophthora sp. Chile5]|nr:hypothetical protein BBJ28_00022711 [Nothophytophthora sp. Chile5]